MEITTYKENSWLGLPVDLGWPNVNEYVLYCDKDGKDSVVGFQHCFQATHFIEALIDNDDYDYIDKDKDIIVTDSGVTIRCDRLKDIIEHEFTIREMCWILSPLFLMQIHYLLYGERSDESPPILGRKSPKISKSQRGNYLGIKPLAAKLGVTPQICRGMLRKSSIEKPSIGWLWKPDEIDNVVKELKED